MSHVAAGSPPALDAGGSAHPPSAWPPLPADPAFLLVAKESRDLPFRPLKVPKCESFDLSDSHDFYFIKPLWVDSFRTVIKIFKISSFWLGFRSLFGENCAGLWFYMSVWYTINLIWSQDSVQHCTHSGSI